MKSLTVNEVNSISGGMEAALFGGALGVAGTLLCMGAAIALAPETGGASLAVAWVALGGSEVASGVAAYAGTH